MGPGLGGGDAAVILPEGTNFSARRRRARIAYLRRSGRHDLAAAAEAMPSCRRPSPGAAPCLPRPHRAGAGRRKHRLEDVLPWRLRRLPGPRRRGDPCRLGDLRSGGSPDATRTASRPGCTQALGGTGRVGPGDAPRRGGGRGAGIAVSGLPVGRVRARPFGVSGLRPGRSGTRVAEARRVAADPVCRHPPGPPLGDVAATRRHHDRDSVIRREAMSAADSHAPATDRAAAPPHRVRPRRGRQTGGYQVGMLRALLERGIVPDLVFGTSVGSLQGALLASNPTLGLRPTHRTVAESLGKRVMSVTPGGLLVNAFRRHPALAPMDALREVVRAHLGDGTRIEDLALPYQCVAASIERAAAATSTPARSCPPSSPPAPCQGFGHPYASATSTTWTAASSRPPRSAGPSPTARPRSTCSGCVSANARCGPRDGPGRSAPRRSRSHADTGLAQILSAHPPGVRMHILPSGEAGPGGADALPRRPA